MLHVVVVLSLTLIVMRPINFGIVFIILALIEHLPRTITSSVSKLIAKKEPLRNCPIHHAVSSLVVSVIA